MEFISSFLAFFIFIIWGEGQAAGIPLAAKPHNSMLVKLANISHLFRFWSRQWGRCAASVKKLCIKRNEMCVLHKISIK